MCSRARIAHDHIIDVFIAWDRQNRFTCMCYARWAIALRVWIMTCPRLSYHTDMPKLRRNFTTCGMGALDDVLPARKWLFAVKLRIIWIVSRTFAVNHSAFRYDKADMISRAALIIGRNILTGYTVWRKAARHWRHTNTVGHCKAAARKWRKKSMRHKGP